MTPWRRLLPLLAVLAALVAVAPAASAQDATGRPGRPGRRAPDHRELGRRPRRLGRPEPARQPPVPLVHGRRRLDRHRRRDDLQLRQRPPDLPPLRLRRLQHRGRQLRRAARRPEPVDAGSWVKIPQENLTLPPGKQATIPISIDIPADASPGDHVAAILASSRAEGTGPDGKVIALDRRTGTRLYVRVAGPVEPKLNIEGVSVNYSPSLNPLSGSATVTYTVANRGNVRLGGTSSVTRRRARSACSARTAPPRSSPSCSRASRSPTPRRSTGCRPR